MSVLDEKQLQVANWWSNIFPYCWKRTTIVNNNDDFLKKFI